MREETMTACRQWKMLGSTLIGSVLLGVFVHCQLRERPGDNPMNKSGFMIDHVRLESGKPFEEVAKAFERQLGTFDPNVRKAATEGSDTEAAKAKIAAMAGSSGFMLFGTQDHGALLRLAGQKRKAIQYVVGNPLIALQMTQHDIRASLYAPLRVLLYETADGKTCIDYDKPSSLFGQFGNAEVDAVAAMLDRKLEALVAAAFE
jgi:uncharacterized protein (DUF302 family)